MSQSQKEHVDQKNGVGKGNNVLTLGSMTFEVDKMSPSNQTKLRDAGITGDVCKPGIICYTRRPIDTHGYCIDHGIPLLVGGAVNCLRKVEKDHPCWRLKELVDKCDKKSPNVLKDVLGGSIIDGQTTKIQVNRSKEKIDLSLHSTRR